MDQKTFDALKTAAIERAVANRSDRFELSAEEYWDNLTPGERSVYIEEAHTTEVSLEHPGALSNLPHDEEPHDEEPHDEEEVLYTQRFAVTGLDLGDRVVLAIFNTREEAEQAVTRILTAETLDDTQPRIEVLQVRA